MIHWRGIKKSDLDPAFLADVHDLLEASPHHWVVLSGLRSLSAQKVLHDKHLAGGPRAAPPGSSAHNYGLAIDVVPDADDNWANGLQPQWVVTAPAWLWLKANTVPHPRLRSGWSFNDAGHIERYKWRKHARRPAQLRPAYA